VGKHSKGCLELALVTLLGVAGVMLALVIWA
jgi:hypothetical protein